MQYWKCFNLYLKQQEYTFRTYFLANAKGASQNVHHIQGYFIKKHYNLQVDVIMCTHTNLHTSTIHYANCSSIIHIYFNLALNL